VVQVYSRVMAEWWNGVELWVAGLAFPLQFALVVVFLGPLCVGVAWVIDRTVDNASTWFGPAPGNEEPIGGEECADVETKVEERADDLVDSVRS
jgi:hypothetical protein